MTTISLSDLVAKTGEVIGTSEWILVDQDMVNKFADATGDHQFIHVNPDMAKMTPFGGTIAHGFLTLSLMPVMMAKSDSPKVEGVKMGVNYGGNKTRFLAPVRVGKQVRGHIQTARAGRKTPRPVAADDGIHRRDRRRRQARADGRMDHPDFRLNELF